MAPLTPRVLSVCLIALALAAGACKKEPPPPPAPVVKPPQEDPSPPLSDEDQLALEADFAAARKLVEEAKAIEADATRAHKAGNKQQAVDTWVKAAQVYGQAVTKVNRWVETGGAKVTDIQLMYRLAPYVAEKDRWVTETASVTGKIQMNTGR